MNKEDDSHILARFNLPVVVLLLVLTTTITIFPVSYLIHGRVLGYGELGDMFYSRLFRFPTFLYFVSVGSLLGVLINLRIVLFGIDGRPAVWISKGVLHCRHVFGIDKIDIDDVIAVSQGPYWGHIQVKGSNKIVNISSIMTRPGGVALLRRLNDLILSS